VPPRLKANALKQLYKLFLKRFQNKERKGLIANEYKFRIEEFKKHKAVIIERGLIIAENQKMSQAHKITKILFCAAALCLLCLCQVSADSNVKALLFYGKGCPHCARMESFLSSISEKYPLEIEKLEVYFNDTNRQLFEKMAAAHNTKVEGVPTLFIGNSVFVGYSKSISEDIEAKIKECMQNKCPDPLSRLSEINTTANQSNITHNHYESFNAGNAKGMAIFAALVLFLITLIVLSVKKGR